MYKNFLKRILDIMVSLCAMPFVLLFVVVFGIAIKLEDGGPVFYNVERVGQYGKAFKMFKLRSMEVNAPDIRTESGDTYNSEDDPRVTKVGKLIRKLSIDEFPQFINVLIGDMSIIGPRPDPMDWLEKYTDEEKIFLEVKPGITGYSQAYFRNSVEAKEKIANDVYYAKHCTFTTDLKVFFKTIAVVLHSDNVYRN